MWERFSYYGMRALLVLYMVDYLIKNVRAATVHVLGYMPLQRGIEAIFGPQNIQPMASQIYGIYTALVYLTPLFGGMIADRLLGQRKTVVIGAVLMAIGQFFLAAESMFLVGLFFLIVGNGCFKPNLATQVGGLYPPGDPRMDRAYSIYYMGVNRAPSWRHWCAARWDRGMAGVTDLQRPGSGWSADSFFIFGDRSFSRKTI